MFMRRVVSNSPQNIIYNIHIIHNFVRVSKKHSSCWVLVFPKRVVNLLYNISVPFILFYPSNITLGYSTLVQQIYLLWKILLVYTLQSIVLLECVQLKSWFLTIQFVFQLHRSKKGSSRTSEQRHTAVLIWPSYFIYQRKYQQTYKIMSCFDTGKLSESRTRNGSVTPVWVGALLV